MSFRYIIDPDTKLALVEKSGEVTSAMLVASARALHADPQWHQGYDVLWDCTGITSLVIAPGELPHVVAAHLEDPCGRDLFVVAREVDYAIAQLCAYLGRREGKESDVYTSMEEALESLGRDTLPEPLRSWRQRGAA